MSDPQEVHDMEQLVSAFATIGGALARMFRAMTDEGMTRKEALAVTQSYARGWASGMSSGGKADQ